ncbi:hypothetical protein EDD18DRAFT_1342867 [Armillaria luteobubalina]|uniref:Heterokaryon incompatibility domain-containing protein n=1 Tax=Armillaria luteobubalina TaxID=153913 RepID=A0AA39QQA3_9AGAR|nr:hypothetical protein EDD18DRAFT_1342867 [Armillaria luteobubalina]
MQANRKSGSSTGQFPEATITSLTEIGQTEESVKVPNQRTYTGRKPIISSPLADITCSSLGMQGLLNLLNTTLRTSYTLDTPSLSSVLEDCIAHNYDLGTAYGSLRSAWCSDIADNRMEQQKCEREDMNRRKNALAGSRIVETDIEPRRVWDLYSNRVVPWWCCRAGYDEIRPISHAWVDEWPVPIPKGANLDLIRIEMLNLGLEYTWLDVLCLRQRGGPRETMRVEEWKLDVPTIGAIYRDASVVCYLSGLGLPLSLKEGDLESDRCWFRRAWTVQEVGLGRTIAGDTPDGPLHAKPIDDAGNYEDKILTKFHKQLNSVEFRFTVYGMLSAMQDRISTIPVDKVAGLAFSMWTTAIPAYYESQSLEDAWTALVNEMHAEVRGTLFFTYPEAGTGCEKWIPSWEQVTDKPLPKGTSFLRECPIVCRDDDNWYEGFQIERGFVRGLAMEGKDRRGELVVENADGIPHSFNILTGHHYPIPEDTYTLLGSDPFDPDSGRVRFPTQAWVIGRRLSNKRFEKVSVLTMPDTDQLERLLELGLSAKSCSILA